MVVGTEIGEPAGNRTRANVVSVGNDMTHKDAEEMAFICVSFQAASVRGEASQGTMD